MENCSARKEGIALDNGTKGRLRIGNLYDRPAVPSEPLLVSCVKRGEESHCTIIVDPRTIGNEAGKRASAIGNRLNLSPISAENAITSVINRCPEGHCPASIDGGNPPEPTQGTTGIRNGS